jgi:hypothetical protein
MDRTPGVKHWEPWQRMDWQCTWELGSFLTQLPTSVGCGTEIHAERFDEQRNAEILVVIGCKKQKHVETLGM